MNIANNINESAGRWARIIEGINLLGLATSDRVLRRLVRKGRVVFAEECLRESDLPQVFNIVHTLKEHYGDNFDATLKYHGAGLYELQLKTLYPNVTIRNSKDMEIHITDLLVMHPFGCRLYPNENKIFYPVRFQGTRLSATELQFQSRYLHSHLPSWSAGPSNKLHPFTTGSFCLGADLLSVMLTEFESEANINAAPINFERYEAMLYAIDSYVRWESLEGVPHFRMQNVSNKGNMVTSFASNLTKTFIDALKLRERIDFDFYISEGKICIDSTEKTIDLVRRVILEDMDDNAKLNLLCVFDPFTRSYFYREKTASQAYSLGLFEDREHYFTIFRGEKRKFKIIKSRQVNVKVKDEDCSINPYFLKDVFRELQNRLHEAQILQSRHRAKSKVRDTRQGTS